MFALHLRKLSTVQTTQLRQAPLFATLQACNYAKKAEKSPIEKLKVKFEQRKKNLELKQEARQKAQVEKLKKWAFEEKIRKMRERREAQQKNSELKKRAKESAKLQQAKTKLKDAKLRAKEKAAAKRAEKPKRAVTPFFWYLKEEFAQLRQALLDSQKTATVSDVAKLARENWSKLEDGQKEKYLALAKQDAERYATERAAFLQKKAANKKPLTGYMLFAADVRSNIVSQLPGVTGRSLAVEVVKRIGKQWNAMPAAEKQKYNDQYAASKAAFDAKNVAKKE